MSWTYGRYASVEPRAGMHQLNIEEVGVQNLGEVFFQAR